MTARRLFLMDPSLVDLAGHHHATTTGLVSAADGRFDDVIVVGNRRMTSDVQAPGIVPGFTDSIYDPIPPQSRLNEDPGRVEATMDRPGRDLLALVRHWKIGPGDVVYFHTLTPNFACRLLRAMALIAARNAPDLALMFRYDPEAEPWIGPFDTLAAALDAAERHGVIHRVRLLAETDRLAQLYADRLGRPVSVLHHFPTPQTAAVSAPADGAITVGYLGEGRIEKGFDAFAGAMADLAARNVKLRLVAQAYCVGDPPAAFTRATEILRPLAARTGGVVHDVLDAEAFAGTLSDVQVIVLPHRLPFYASRGSGLFIDALAGGAVVVVRAGTWMSGFADRPNVLVFDDDADLATRIEEAIGLAASTSRAQRTQWADGLFSASRHIDMLVSRPEDKDGTTLMTEQRPTALVITKFWPQTGAAHVFRSQVAMLQANGFEVSVATITSFALEEPPSEETYQWYRDTMDLPPVNFHWVCFANDRLLDCVNEIARGMVGVDDSWTAETLRAMATDLPASLRQFCADTPPELIVCNYLSHLPLASSLKGPDTKVVVETHDLCSVQYAMTSGHPLSEVDYRAELSAGRTADGLVFINPDEAGAFDRAGILTPAMTVLPARSLDLDTGWVDALAAAEQALDRPALIDATRAMFARLIGTGSNPAGAARVAAALRRAGTAGKLLVYVGSDHEWNIRGLAEFIDTAFLPRLQSEGYSLIVAGSVCDWLGQTYPETPGIVRAGVLPDLRPVYELPSTIVLPVVGGTGFPIKTLDALASGRPVVATPLAVRGLDASAQGIQVAELDAMADAILAEDAARDGRASARDDMTFAGYCAKWAAFLSDRLGRPVEPQPGQDALTRPLEIAPDVATILAADPARLTPIPAGNHPITEDTLPMIAAGSFGFAPRPAETGWLWSSSWYCGFLLAPEARAAQLFVELCEVALPDWAGEIDIDVYIDGHRHVIQITRETTEILIPLYEAPTSGDAPVLVEFVMPDAVLRSSEDGRYMTFCVVKVETLTDGAPAVIAADDYADLDDADFVAFAYDRILGKEADQDGLAHFLDQLWQGTPRSDILRQLADSPDSILKTGLVLR